MILKDLLILVAGMLLIIKSADYFTNGAETVAQTFKIPRLVVGATIVSIATTAPEFTVSTISSYMKLDGMALGNAVGSCLANIGLILGIAAIIKPIDIRPRVIKHELPLYIFFVLTLYMLSLNSELDICDGLVSIFLLILFIIFIVFREIKTKVKEKFEISSRNIKKDIIKFILGAIGVVVSAKYAIIPSGVNIARFLNVPEVVIGLSMVAIGTSLPELVTAVMASVKNMGELAIGNVIGANILNILWVLGISSMINPISVDIQTKMIAIPLMISMALLLLILSKTSLKISRWEGLVLLLCYMGYLGYLFGFAYR